MTQSLVYTKRDIKRMFDVGDKTLYRWVKSGRFPAPILPGRWDRATVDSFGHFRTSSVSTPEINRHDDIRL